MVREQRPLHRRRPHDARREDGQERVEPVFGPPLVECPQATRRQPENAQTWLQKAQYELAFGCARAALKDFYRFNALDPYERPDNGPDQYRQALRQVNTGKPT